MNMATSFLLAGREEVFNFRKRRNTMSTEVQIHERLPLAQAIPLGLQHVFAMFGATVLVPFLTGLSP